MHQLSLFHERPSLQERFERFDRENEHVFRLFVRFAREAKRKGRTRWSSKAIWERLRWELSLETDESPALNNDYTAFFARKLVSTYPDEFAGFFELRSRKHQGG